MILDEIVKSKEHRLQRAKKDKSFEKIKEEAEIIAGFRKCIEKNGGQNIFVKDKMMIIAEVKKASPSKGKLDFKFDIPELVLAYEQGGADIISVVTEEDHFLGGESLFREVYKSTNLPLLRKDFIIDTYQIYESKIMGASLVLLICAILDDVRLKDFINLSSELGLVPLVEVHTKKELEKALKAGAYIIGINNRNLINFKTSLENTRAILPYVPKDKIVISESGIKGAKDILELKKMGKGHACVDGVLVGESVVESKNPVEKIKELKFCLDNKGKGAI